VGSVKRHEKQHMQQQQQQQQAAARSVVGHSGYATYTIGVNLMNKALAQRYKTMKATLTRRYDEEVASLAVLLACSCLCDVTSFLPSTACTALAVMIESRLFHSLQDAARNARSLSTRADSTAYLTRAEALMEQARVQAREATPSDTVLDERVVREVVVRDRQQRRSSDRRHDKVDKVVLDGEAVQAVAEVYNERVSARYHTHVYRSVSERASERDDQQQQQQRHTHRRRNGRHGVDKVRDALSGRGLVRYHLRELVGHRSEAGVYVYVCRCEEDASERASCVAQQQRRREEERRGETRGDVLVVESRRPSSRGTLTRWRRHFPTNFSLLSLACSRVSSGANGARLAV